MAGPVLHTNATNGPVVKRQKVQSEGDSSSAPLVRQSKIFAPFRVSFSNA